MTTAPVRSTADRLVRAVHRRLHARCTAVEERLLDLRLRSTTRGSVAVDRLDVAGGRADGHGYTATPAPMVRMVLDAATARPAEHAFVDMGSGKGRTVLQAARHGYRRAVGVEFARDLHEVAVANAARHPRWADVVELRLGDAGATPIPAGPLVVYFNNPFKEPVMRAVLDNLTASWTADPRPVTLVYQQLRDEDDPTRNLELLAATPWLDEGVDVVPRGAYRRFMLGMFTVRMFRSPQALSGA
jgi:SAM-dependent methyltransferase